MNTLLHITILERVPALYPKLVFLMAHQTVENGCVLNERSMNPLPSDYRAALIVLRVRESLRREIERQIKELPLPILRLNKFRSEGRG